MFNQGAFNPSPNSRSIGLMFLTGVPLLIGLAVIAGWLTDTSWLVTILPGSPAMQFNTALLLIVSSLGLALFLQEQKTALIFNGLALAFAFLTLCEYLFGWGLGIDQFFFSVGDADTSAYPGRMAVNTALDFLVFNATVVINQLYPNLRIRWTGLGIGGSLVLGIAAASVVGYLGNIEAAYRWGLFNGIGMALHTALSFVLLSLVLLLNAGQQETRFGLSPRFPALLIWVVGGIITLGVWRASALLGVNFILVVGFLLTTGLAFTIYRLNRRLSLDLDNTASQMAAILDSAMDAIISIDETQRIIRFNPAAESIFGYRASEVIGAPIDMFIPEQFRGAHQDHIRSFANTGASSRTMGQLGVVTGLRANGTQFPIEASISQVVVAGERTFTVILRDVEDRMEAEERFRLAIEHAPNAIVIVNSEGEISLANLQAEQDFGYSRAELIGRNVDLLVPTRFRNDHRAHRAGYQANPAIRSMGVGRELFGLRRDGSEFPIEIGLAPISMRNEKLVMATVIDITERKQAEDQLRLSIEQLTHSNEELEQFAYVASHDLQEPLRVVTSYLELIERYYADKLDADGKEYIEFTVDAARRMKSLIQDLLAFSRVGTRNEPPEIIDPNASLKTALSNLETMIAESDALIHSDNLLPVMADPSQMVLVFQNLISNSIKFRGDAPPEIRVSSRKEGGWVHFNLSDNGVGFDQKHAERIFIIFKRLHAKNEYEGTGLGLAITKKVIERHGGSIHAEGKVGKGASFFFSLPAARESFQFDEQPIKEEDSLEERARRLL